MRTVGEEDEDGGEGGMVMCGVWLERGEGMLLKLKLSETRQVRRDVKILHERKCDFEMRFDRYREEQIRRKWRWRRLR